MMAESTVLNGRTCPDRRRRPNAPARIDGDDRFDAAVRLVDGITDLLHVDSGGEAFVRVVDATHGVGQLACHYE